MLVISRFIHVLCLKMVLYVYVILPDRCIFRETIVHICMPYTSSLKHPTNFAATFSDSIMVGGKLTVTITFQ